jgi:ATP-dependent DNA helicase RecQ
VPVIALTASATKEVQDDICAKLEFQKGYGFFQQAFDRPNIAYHVIEPVSRPNVLVALLKKNDGTAIVYASSRKQTESTAALLNMNGLDAGFYHAGLSKEERSQKQEDWIKNKLKIIVCTNAFGMGIDKPDVRTVIHYMIPESLENYYQEAGRAGRDGLPSNVYLLYDKKDAEQLRKTNELRYPAPEILKLIYTALMNHLQIAAGSGEGQTFDFDITTFAASFKINPMQASYALQTMAQEGLFYISESAFRYSKVVFTCTKDELRNLEMNYPGAIEMTKALLRSYEGIFDHSSSIFEKQLGALFKIPSEQVVKQLQFLNRISIINYIQQSDKPQITLLKNRMYSDEYRFDNASVKKRKEIHLQRINAVTGYAENHHQCRSKIIANYFNDINSKPCGNCDNCLAKKKENTTGLKFKEIAENIKSLLNESSKTPDELYRFFNQDDLSHVKTALDYLIQEGIIVVIEFGKLSTSSKKS